MTKNKFRKINLIFKGYPKIKLVYFFGSRIKIKGGPLSDYDFAFYLEEKDKKKIARLQLKLINKLTRFLKTDKVDVIMLNLIENPELKYNIIQEGKLISEREPYKVLIEPRILNEYFDFRQYLLNFKLTKPR